MNRPLRALALAAGAAILALLVRQVGVETLLEGARAVGWWVVPLVALHAVVYGLNTLAWWITLAHEPGAPPLRTLFRIMIVGFAINFLTPIVNAGGEPYRIAALTPWIGTRRAAGSVLQYAMLHALSSLLMWLTAIATALTLRGVDTRLRWALGGLALVIVLALLAVRSGHRHGFVTRLTTWIARRRLGRLSEWLARREADFEAVDAQLIALHRDQRGRLTAAIAVDYLSRLVAVGELLIVASAVGHAMSWTAATMISGLSALAVNIFFILPYEMGSREGSLYALFALAGVPASVGMIAAVLTRIREIAWCVLGLLLAGKGGRRAAREAAATTTT
jgi:uncharacterized protein (TIRG00374 family)